MSDEWSEARLRSLLRTRRFGQSLRWLDETASTNDDAKLDAQADVPSGHAVVADGQSGGRGSHGRAWSSPKGTDLYVSIVDRPLLALSELPPLTLAIGLGVAEAVQSLLGASQTATVKWPNDVWIQQKKCAGVLVETASANQRVEAVIIGVGLNVNRETFDPELTQAATTVGAQLGRKLDRTQVLATLLHSIERWVDRFYLEGLAPVIPAVSDRLALRGEYIRCGDVEGVLRGIAPSGGLRIETLEGLRTVSSGSIERIATRKHLPHDH